MAAACWNVYMLPIGIAFKIQDSGVDIVDSIVDICFVLDIIISFRTTILDDDEGIEI